MSRRNGARPARLHSRGLGILLLLCAFPTFGGPPEAVEGTWRLIARELSDGRILRPPEVVGLLSMSNGFRNMNVAWMDSSGKWSSHSVVAAYQITDTQYTETLLFSAYHNSKNGDAVHYGVAGSTQTVPVTTNGGAIMIPVPWGEPAMTFDGIRMTATLAGAFVDRWERIRQGANVR